LEFLRIQVKVQTLKASRELSQIDRIGLTSYRKILLMISWITDPTIKLRNAYIEMERGLVPSELLAIRTVLKKDPEEYSYNTYQRIVGTQEGRRCYKILQINS
jgi:hypothetical protein